MANTNIFTLNDNVEDLQEKIDLDELYEKKRQQDLNNLEIFNKVLNKIHQKIKKTSTLGGHSYLAWASAWASASAADYDFYVQTIFCHIYNNQIKFMFSFN